ncbi:MAG: hypothetical protein FWJ93_09780 [Micromonosporaceae bacterium]
MGGIPDASPFDAGAIADGLRADELDWFDQRREEVSKRRGDGDPEILVAAHTVDVDPADWTPFLDVLEPHLEIDGLTLLNQGDVTDVARRCRQAQR